MMLKTCNGYAGRAIAEREIFIRLSGFAAKSLVRVSRGRRAVYLKVMGPAHPAGDTPADFSIYDVVSVRFGRDRNDAGAAFAFADFVMRGDTYKERTVIEDRAYVLNEYGTTIETFVAAETR